MVPSQTRFNPFYDSGGYAECYVCGIGSYEAAKGHPNNGCSAVGAGIRSRLQMLREVGLPDLLPGAPPEET